MKTFALLASAIIFGCGGPSKTAEIETVENKNETVDNELITKYFQSFNQHDWKNFANFYADKVQMKDPSFGTEVKEMSKSEIEKKYTELSQTIPDVKDSVVNIYPVKDGFTVEFISSGTAPDGKKFKLPICTIFKLEKGKITADYTYYDNF